MRDERDTGAARPARSSDERPVDVRGRHARDHERRRGLVGYLTHKPDPLTSLLLTIPVFLVYHLGILGIQYRNGVDWVSNLTFELLEQSFLAYVGVTVGFAIGIAAAVYFLRRQGTLRSTSFLPVIAESTLWAVVMLFAVGWATNEIFSWQVGPTPNVLGPFERIVMAAGAGFHEELTFRVLLFAGLAFLMRLPPIVGLGKVTSLIAAGVISSLLFSAVHYIPPHGDSFTFISFTFRALAGVFLALVFQLRGFAVAVYTHTFYDLIVFFLIS